MRMVLAALALVACGARGLDAQRVNGQVRDEETDAPVSGASLQLLDERGQAVHSATSDARGAFTLRARQPGTYRIRASRVGYRDATSAPVDLTAPTILSVEVRLGTSAVRLDPLVVVGIPRYEVLEDGGFYQRRDHFGPDGIGEAVFLEQHDIERLNPYEVNDIFRYVPGVRMERGTPQMRMGCLPAIVVNGFLARRGVSRTSRQSTSTLPSLARREVMSPQALVGVEVYTGTSVPGRFMADSGGCGVIMFWTK
jgi:hypothetical protein